MDKKQQLVSWATLQMRRDYCGYVRVPIQIKHAALKRFFLDFLLI